ncbi:TetR/AcrR family transcriptional regulator [Streptomyces huasconensis]|uniref:TetR/AcrR family transcriptional regulator n=1 Tax=Streptomyces TaxID=1883 RepID=UPI0038B5488D
MAAEKDPGTAGEAIGETAGEPVGEPKKRRAGRPRRLEPETIVATARRILQEEGVAALSMRRVAKEVGTTPMALYHHVRDKDDLLMLTLSGTAATVPRPELPSDPRERLLAVTLHMHGTLARMPWVVEVLSLGDLTDKGALWMVEEIVGAGVACGLTPAEAVRAYRTLWHCVYGDLVFRRAMERRAEDPDRKRYFPGMLTDADAAELPHLVALADQWSELTEDYDVSGQLSAVIDGLLGRAGRADGTGRERAD